MHEKINIQLFQNPVTEQLNIILTSNGNSGLDKVEMYNSIGELLLQKVLSGENSTNIDFLNTSEGIYTIRVYSGSNIISRMVTKVN